MKPWREGLAGTGSASRLRREGINAARCCKASSRSHSRTRFAG